MTTDANGAYSVSGLASGQLHRAHHRHRRRPHRLHAELRDGRGTAGPFDYQEAVECDHRRRHRRQLRLRPARPDLCGRRLRDGVRGRRGGHGGVADLARGRDRGFHLLRRDPATGEDVRVTERLVPGLLVHPQGGVYRFRDAGAPTEGPLAYTLVEVDVRGRSREYGPFSVSSGDGAPRPSTSESARDLRGRARSAAGPSPRPAPASPPLGRRRRAAAGGPAAAPAAGPGPQGHDPRGRDPLRLRRRDGDAARPARGPGRGPDPGRPAHAEPPGPRRAPPAGRGRHRHLVPRRGGREPLHRRERLLADAHPGPDHGGPARPAVRAARRLPSRRRSTGAGGLPRARQLPRPGAGLLGLGLPLRRVRRPRREELRDPREGGGRGGHRVADPPPRGRHRHRARRRPPRRGLAQRSAGGRGPLGRPLHLRRRVRRRRRPRPRGRQRRGGPGGPRRRASPRASSTSTPST